MVIGLMSSFLSTSPSVHEGEEERWREEEREEVLFQSQLEYYLGADRWNQGVIQRVLGIVLSFLISLLEMPLNSFHKWT